MEDRLLTKKECERRAKKLEKIKNKTTDIKLLDRILRSLFKEEINR